MWNELRRGEVSHQPPPLYSSEFFRVIFGCSDHKRASFERWGNEHRSSRATFRLPRWAPGNRGNGMCMLLLTLLFLLRLLLPQQISSFTFIGVVFCSVFSSLVRFELLLSKRDCCCCCCCCRLAFPPRCLHRRFDSISYF